MTRRECGKQEVKREGEKKLVSANGDGIYDLRNSEECEVVNGMKIEEKIDISDLL